MGDLLLRLMDKLCKYYNSPRGEYCDNFGKIGRYVIPTLEISQDHPPTNIIHFSHDIVIDIDID